ncbi:MAG: hypothetical protein IT349_10925 [Candidatus Eisenbacteria bacterium]|nr:hypothetical protein [Candidatus Eisenbacteria bacterium]MCC7142600.1 hypothetical protein [Candidatus Eisenbacteria bacterium]
MPDWRDLCRGIPRLRLSDDGKTVEVPIARGRFQRIEIRETSETFELSGVIARRSVLRTIEDAALRIWRRNRTTALVGFRIDARDRLVGEAWLPKAGVTRVEFVWVLRHIASECDLLEFHLTGRDRE